MSFDLSFLNGYVDPELLAAFIAFVQVVFIDIVMAGDNAVAVGIAASGLAADKRRQAIFYGLIGAIITRIAFVLLTVQLFKIVGLLFIGGLLLLWVCWKMWEDLRHPHDPALPARKAKTLLSAIAQILVADISMSLDNVLAVTGAAADHVPVLAFGLLFSIAAMGFAANYIATVLHKYRWIGYVGLIVVLLVACKMIYEGGMEIWIFGHCDSSLKCGPVMARDAVIWWRDVIQNLIAHKA